ncbi:hypothetical protein CWS72_06635 [Telmatospirillum siberiense]|uniref:Uncharacterized protein n=1 Tax=Telmatospirillum siberiense TaxID=382514 RepID=A0A2N3PY03_9PROT|nr:hypothetical protein CWS72_06635 [Telmatospirillum siberiense]
MKRSYRLTNLAGCTIVRRNLDELANSLTRLALGRPSIGDPYRPMSLAEAKSDDRGVLAG